MWDLHHISSCGRRRCVERNGEALSEKLSVGKVFDGGSESLGGVVGGLSLGRYIFYFLLVGCEFQC